MTTGQKITCWVVAISLYNYGRHPSEFKKICDYIRYTLTPFIPTKGAAHKVLTFPVKAGQVGDAFITAGCTTAADMEAVGNFVLTYPWDRYLLPTRPEQFRRTNPFL